MGKFSHFDNLGLYLIIKEKKTDVPQLTIGAGVTVIVHNIFFVAVVHAQHAVRTMTATVVFLLSPLFSFLNDTAASLGAGRPRQ